MEFGQEAITTLHDFGGAEPVARADGATVVVPMVGREGGSRAARRLFEGLERVDPLEVLVPLRAGPGRAADIADWVEGYDLDVTVLYCAGDRLAALLADHGLDGPQGKGSDVWLAMGVARGDHVVLHDADAQTYEPRDTRKLLAPLTGAPGNAAAAVDDDPFRFVKGYYARVEAGRLYGRLTRLFYGPLVSALAARHDHPLLTYLAAFRYALAGECAMTTELARTLPVERRWGFEAGTLAAVQERAGAAGTAQVDLGRYEHEHRGVEGPGGLSAVSEGVAGALFRALEDRGVDIDYRDLPGAYRTAARRRVRADAADAAFNDLEHDAADELAQVDTYASSIAPPGVDDRLPPWTAVDLDRAAVECAAADDLAAARDAASPLAGDAEP